MSQVPAARVVVTPAPSVTVIKPVPPIDPRTPPNFDRRRVRRWATVVSLVLLAAYLLLENPYWVPGGDSDFYVASARSMARGHGFLYNDLPVAISPPGWPWVMAQVMKLSPTFLALKLTTLVSMFASLVIGYYIALRFLRPSAAAWATVLAGVLMPVYSLTYFLHSEAVYCLLSAIALLLALRIREGRGGSLHVVALLAISAALPLMRWAGLFQLLPIAAVLVSGPTTLPWKRRHWKVALACVLVIGGSFVAAKAALHLSEEQLKKIADDGGATGSGEDTEIREAPTEVTGDRVLTGPDEKNKSLAHEYAERVGQSGKWFAWLLWQPTRFVEFNKVMAFFVALIGWGVIALLAYLAVHEAKRGEWLWVSLGLYTGGICLGWNNVNSRYFVPLAPLILVGLSLATRRLGERFPARTFDFWKWLRRGMVYSILACNLAMFGVDVIVMRSRNFYETFEAGQHKDLIAAAWYLTQSLPPAPATQPSTLPTTAAAATNPTPTLGPAYRLIDTKLLVNQRYDNLGRAKDSKAGTRAMVLLTDRVVKPLDGRSTKIVRPTPDPTPGRPPYPSKFVRMIRQKNTEWYFAQDKVVPWRVWHFRVPDWLYKTLAKTDTVQPSSGWKLYRFDRVNATFTEYPFPPMENWPTRVPGM